MFPIAQRRQPVNVLVWGKVWGAKELRESGRAPTMLVPDHADAFAGV